jgi:hypothetical protein
MDDRKPRSPTDPERVVTVFDTDMPYAVAVEMRRDDAGYYVTSVSVRRHPEADGWHGERTTVSPRDVQRLPLAKFVRTALAVANSGTSAQRGAAVRKNLAPHARPKRGKSASFYRKIGELHREYAKRGLSPAKEIARRMGVPENATYQWFHRARELGFLEPPLRLTRSKGSNDG